MEKIKPPLEQMNESLKRYYLQDTLSTFHQKEMRELFENLDKLGISWYASDMIKCFVKNIPKTDNRKIAEENCFENYLKKQIVLLEPKIILMLGGAVSRKVEDNLRIKFHKKTEFKKINDKFSAYFIRSTFPAQWTADKWIKENGWSETIQAICSILNK